MNYCYVLFFLTSFFYSDSWNQNKNPLDQGTVFYTYNLLGNTEIKELIFKGNESVYKHHQDAKTFITPEGYAIYSHKRHFDWFLNSRTNEVTHYERLRDGVLIFSIYKPYEIKWEITDETKTLLGFKVQKAIAKDHPFSKGSSMPGGDAVAWFAVDIPCNSGPEKYWGLPGLILELRFTSFKGFYMADKISTSPVEIVKPKDGIQVPKDQLLKREGIDKKWLKNARELLNNDN